MSLANRLAQLDAELDAFQKPPEALEGVRARLLASRPTELGAVDGELDALAADIAGLDAVLEAARQEASSRAAQVASLNAEQAERARAARAEVDARLAAQNAEQEAARAARAKKAAEDAAAREAAAAQRAEQAAAEQAQREAAAAERAQREAAERAERAANAAREREVAAARPASRPPAMDESAATTLSQLLADELEDEQSELAAPTDTMPAAESNTDDTDLFGTDLFGDLGADAFDAPQDRLDDVVSSDDHGAKPSAFVDLASLLEQEEARPAASPAPGDAATESDDLMAALFADTPEEAAPAPVESRPKTVPPPVPTPGSVRPPALAASVIEGARESFEDLSDEIDMMEVDDFEIVIDDSGDEGSATGTELDGPGLTPEELAPDAMHTTPDGPEDPDKKGGFFKKLFR